MDIWEYVPGFVGRPLVRGIKKIWHTNENRRIRLDLGRENDLLEMMLFESQVNAEKSRVELGMLNRKKAVLELQVMKAQETAAWTEEARVKEKAAHEKVKEAYVAHNAAILTGNAEYLTREVKEALNINNGLEGLTRSTLAKNGSLSEEVKELEHENFKYRVSAVINDNQLARFPAFAYANGKVFGTSKLNKYCKRSGEVEEVLAKDENLKVALDEGKEHTVNYNGMDLVFLANKKHGDVTVAYVVPEKRESRAKLFAKAGIEAAKTLRKSLRGDYSFEGVSFV